MIHAITHTLRLTRLRPPVLALLAALVGSACDNSNPLATSEPSTPPTALATTDSLPPTDSLSALAAPSLAVGSYSGIPFGPFGLWNSYTSVYSGPAPFTHSQSFVDASGIVTLINSARLKRQRLVLAMAGGSSTRYTTNGRFDMGKWQNKMRTFNSATIRNAIANAVADGTVIGNAMIDEPETKRWGGNVTKATLDAMAGFAKGMFPTLPQGVNHGATGYKWRSSERYYKVDYVNYQYVWWVTTGNVAAFRDAALARSRHDGVATSFSINILGGGVQDKDGYYNCAGSGQAGKGPYYPTCRMTPEQVRGWGQTLGPAGCMLLMWTYDGAYMAKSANQQAFRDVAYSLASKPRRSCRRP